jgi:hypothetical protein
MQFQDLLIMNKRNRKKKQKQISKISSLRKEVCLIHKKKETCKPLECEYYYPPKLEWWKSQEQIGIKIWKSGHSCCGKPIGIWTEFDKEGNTLSSINHDTSPN